jgi:hypothetical protein
LLAELETLAAFSDQDPPGISRLVFAEADQKSRAWLKTQCSAAGLAVREDAVGNMFARWQGSQPDLPAIGTGSHIDAIPHSGMYDGTVGVLGDPFAAAQRLCAAAFDRALAVHRGRAHPLWSRLPGQPHADRRPQRRSRPRVDGS